jgi:hypothetical protein
LGYFSFTLFGSRGKAIENLRGKKVANAPGVDFGTYSGTDKVFVEKLFKYLKNKLILI